VQDPAFTAKSTLAKPIGVPLCAITTSKAFRAQGGGNPPHSKKRKHTRATETNGIATASDTDEMEDIQFLLSDDEGDNGGVQG
jgi:ubiquitin-conjugating enzyme E2 Q